MLQGSSFGIQSNPLAVMVGRAFIQVRSSTMCLTCGCMDAHKVMGNNVTYENLKKIADGNGKTVEETLKTIRATADKDRPEHPAEYSDATP
jgi:hypothetical protein